MNFPPLNSKINTIPVHNLNWLLSNYEQGPMSNSHFFAKKNLTKNKSNKYYANFTPSMSMVESGFLNFVVVSRSKSSTENCGSPIKVGTTETIAKINDIMLTDRRLKVALHHKSHSYHIVQRFRFWMITWEWESFPQAGCRVGSHFTTNAIV